jgi:hypothetical protein
MLAFVTLTLVLAVSPGQAAVAGSATGMAEESLLAAARVDLEARVQELGLSGAAPLVGMREHATVGAVHFSSQPARPEASAEPREQPGH